MVFEGNGMLREFIGGFTDVENWYKEQQEKRQHEKEEKEVKNETNSHRQS